MSPKELSGKSFGRLPDRRSCTCEKCGRNFRDYRLRQNKLEKATGIVRLTCRYCGHHIKIVKLSQVDVIK